MPVVNSENDWAASPRLTFEFLGQRLLQAAPAISIRINLADGRDILMAAVTKSALVSTDDTSNMADEAGSLYGP